MAYREVTMIEITEVLRQCRVGRWPVHADRTPARARPENGHRYLRTAGRCGLEAGMDASSLTEVRLAEIVTALRVPGPRAYGDGWQQCVAHRGVIAAHVIAGVRVSKVRWL